MSCEDIQELISDYIDGAASPEDEARVREHLASCPECRELHDQWKRINDALRDGPAEEPGEPYWDSYRGRLQSRLSLEPRRVRGTGSVYTWGWAAAAVLLIALAAAVWIAASQARRASEAESRQVAVRSQPMPVPAPPVLPAALGAGAATDMKLFHELDLTFDGGIKWVATDGKKIDFGVSTELSPAPRPVAPAGPAAAGASDRVAAVAVSVRRAEAGQAAPINEARIVGRSGHRADFSTQAGGLELTYECQPTIASDLEARLQLGVGVGSAEGGNYGAASAALDLQSGQTAEVARVVSGGISYVFEVTLVILPVQGPGKQTGA